MIQSSNEKVPSSGVASEVERLCLGQQGKENIWITACFAFFLPSSWALSLFMGSMARQKHVA